MLKFRETPYSKSLSDGLILRTAANADDVERVAQFNGYVHQEESIVGMTQNLFLHHPHTDGKDLIFVEDEASGQVVSSLCLIPWTWRCAGVEIPTGELGIVGTLEAYRRRGLIREQVTAFKRRLGERGCLLSQIQGIPYYYRQFGYEYALPLEGGLRLELRHVPEPPDAAYAFRQATTDDVPVLATLYNEAMQDLEIHTVRDAATWWYLLTRSAGTEMAHDTWLIEEKDGDERILGYFCVPHHHFGRELVVNEVSRLSFDAAIATLDHLKQLAVKREKPGIRLNLPAECTLMKSARALDAYDMGTYAWQIHVPDVTALLRTLAPALERRVAASPFAGLTREVRISLYCETIALRFEAGQLIQVANLGFTDWVEESVRSPPLQFTPMMLGYRTWEEMAEAYPDIDVNPGMRMLTDTLFPKMTAFIYSIY